MQSRATLIIYFRPSPTHSRLYEAVGVSGLAPEAEARAV
jgi:hypothetical protein